MKLELDLTDKQAGLLKYAVMLLYNQCLRNISDIQKHKESLNLNLRKKI